MKALESLTNEEISEMMTDMRAKDIIAEGYLNQILISQDVCYKMNLSCFGGPGYSHILTTVIPFMRQKNITKGRIHALIVENPRRAVSFT